MSMDDTAAINTALSEPSHYSEQEMIRRAKLEKLRSDGHDPYLITRFPATHTSADILSRFEELDGQDTAIAGRMLSRRIMGKASFAHIQGGNGSIQIYVKRDDVGEETYAAFKDYDIGDILGIKGFVFRTQKGEVSVHAKEIILLSKSLKPLPEKFHGLTDTDLRYRQRYIDLIMNPQVRDVFIKRARIISAVREFLDARGFLEVDTPILHTLETGASARPFITRHNTLNIPMYLRIELELSLKRLIVGGFDKVYEIGRIFRNEGMDQRHNPEFTMVETYEAYADYNDVMEMVERLHEYVALKVNGTTDIIYQGEPISLAAPWKRLTMTQAVLDYSGVDTAAWSSDEEARAAVAAKGVHVEKDAARGDCLNALFEEYVEPNLRQPTFITEYPVEISTLAKRMPGKPHLTERFEFFMLGGEFGNAFSELNDPIDQRARFERQVSAMRASAMGEGRDPRVDEDFIDALEYGLPPTGGLGIGIDRMVMLLTDSPSIRDVLLFPTMKPR